MTNNISLADCIERDRCDPLASFRDRFVLPAGKIYFDGNSLGALPSATWQQLQHTIQQEWGHDLIESWFKNGWFDLSRTIGDQITRLIGARDGEVIACDSTSVNLYKLAVAALNRQREKGKTTLLTEQDNFPTDSYILKSMSEVVVAERGDLIRRMNDKTALLSLTHTDYRTGEIHDMAALTKAAHNQGAMVLWDLSHSAGAMPVDLNGCEADLAVGCGYKYLNGGPGAPAWLYVAKRWQNELQSPLPGWMGHADPFAFGPDYRPADGIARFSCGTPGIIGLRALETGIATFDGADIATLREKSMRLGDLFLDLAEERIGFDRLKPACPMHAEDRGSQVSFQHPDSARIMAELIAKGVIGDFRPPAIIRFGLTPLYTRYQDIYRAVEVLAKIIDKG